MVIGFRFLAPKQIKALTSSSDLGALGLESVVTFEKVQVELFKIL